jgi:hypothetical protein
VKRSTGVVVDASGYTGVRQQSCRYDNNEHAILSRTQCFEGFALSSNAHQVG